MAQKVINLKNRIEKEITEIDKLYDNTFNKITKLFEEKHEKLLLEEKNIKEGLQNEVTKIKEKLENNLTESNKLIRINEKINKGFKLLENEEEKNIIKNLSYISKINKNKKSIKILLQELIKSEKIFLQEDGTSINYEEYYINGIQIPNNIEFKDITLNTVKVFWKIDNIKIENIDNNQIKYKVEIRKENSNDKFIQVYEGNNYNCLIENLEKNTNYEIRICCVYNNLIGSWSKIEKFNTPDIDSIILSESKRGNEFLKKIYEWSGYKRMELLYRGTKDGTTADVFHKKCDNQGPTICLYKNEKGNIFGGYASISWTNSGSNKSAPDSFIFTLTNIYGTEPTRFLNSNKNYGVFHYSNQGPVFGLNEILIVNDFRSNNNITHFPEYYEDILGKGKSIFTGETDNNNNKLNVVEIEVFKLFK